MRRLRGERGQMTIPLMLIVVAMLAGSLMLFQVGKATDLQAQATSAADAGALAAAEEIKDQFIQHLYTYGYSVPFVPNVIVACAEAARYVASNEGVITGCAPLGVFTYRVSARTAQALDTDGHLEESDGARGSWDATAIVDIKYLFSPPRMGGGGGGGAPAGGGGGGGAGTNGNGGNVEQYIAALAPEMAAEVTKLNEAMGGTLVISSGYRSAAYQAQLCQRVTGPCAPPGRSMHQYGLAIDVGNWSAALTALRANPDINLCHPLPGNDDVHFSYGGSPECGGSRGALRGGGDAVSPAAGATYAGGTAGGIFGGDITSYMGFAVHLIDGP